MSVPVRHNAQTQTYPTYRRGTIMLCVLPTADMDPLRSVKWHPRDPDLVTVTSDNNIYIINIADAAHIFAGQPINQSELHRVSSVWSVASVSYFFSFPRHDHLITLL